MMQRFDALPHVDGALNYIAPMTERPRTLTYEPAPGLPGTNIVPELHIVPIRNVRPIVSDINLDREGFAVLPHLTAVRDFYDDDEVRRVYYPEAEHILQEVLGADRVFVFDHTVRRRVSGVADRAAGAPRQPVGRVHVDHTDTSGPQRIRDFLGEQAEELLRGRAQVINVWRPIRGPLRDAPLAICAAESVAADDLIASDLVYRDRVGEIYSVRYRPQHRWFYVPEMRSDEVLLLKCYDSAKDGRARFAPHTAFEDPTAPNDVLPRESIELRTFVFHA
jgi:hypothetical protein